MLLVSILRTKNAQTDRGHIIGVNVSLSLNNFAVALLGFKWANELCVHLPDGERQAQLRETFLRFEQLTGYFKVSSQRYETYGHHACSQEQVVSQIEPMAI